MSEIVTTCPKCERKGFLKLSFRGTHTALECDNCRSWIKWVGQKDILVYKKVLANQSSDGNCKKNKFEYNIRRAIIDLGLSREDVLEVVEKIYS